MSDPNDAVERFCEAARLACGRQEQQPAGGRGCGSNEVLVMSCCHAVTKRRLPAHPVSLVASGLPWPPALAVRWSHGWIGLDLNDRQDFHPMKLIMLAMR